MAEHKTGSMNIRAQEKTFHGFIKMITWAGIISVLTLIFLALANG